MPKLKRSSASFHATQVKRQKQRHMDKTQQERKTESFQHQMDSLKDERKQRDAAAHCEARLNPEVRHRETQLLTVKGARITTIRAT